MSLFHIIITENKHKKTQDNSKMTSIAGRATVALDALIKVSLITICKEKNTRGSAHAEKLS